MNNITKDSEYYFPAMYNKYMLNKYKEIRHESMTIGGLRLDLINMLEHGRWCGEVMRGPLEYIQNLKNVALDIYNDLQKQNKEDGWMWYEDFVRDLKIKELIEG